MLIFKALFKEFFKNTVLESTPMHHLASLLGDYVSAVFTVISELRENLEKEIERHKVFHSSIMGKQEEKYEVKDVDIRNYAKYVLEKGSVFEKRDLLKNIKSKIMVLGKKIVLN